MDIIGYLVLGYMVFGVFLVFWAFYLSEKLKRYIDAKYPEEGRIIRSYEWQWFPWSVGYRTLKALIKKQSPIDSELARRAKWTRRGSTYFFTWFAIALIMFFIRLLFLILK
jgi:hypothetical protein